MHEIELAGWGFLVIRLLEFHKNLVSLREGAAAHLSQDPPGRAGWA
jgi:hypothetical protein